MTEDVISLVVPLEYEIIWKKTGRITIIFFLVQILLSRVI